MELAECKRCGHWYDTTKVKFFKKHYYPRYRQIVYWWKCEYCDAL